jgi:PKHD-type hydroxylase
MWESAFDNETCDRWIEAGRQVPQEDATTFGKNAKHRKTEIRWLPDSGIHAEIHNAMRDYAHRANEIFDVELRHLPPIQFTEYADVGDHYDWHHDIDWDRHDDSQRKLSITIQLSDSSSYTGGDFSIRYFESPENAALRQRGSVLVFLPYLEHRVTPIESGSRISLVGWYEGPKWR